MPYRPRPWADDAVRRTKAAVPEDVVFRTKPEFALDQIRAALAAGSAPGVVAISDAHGVALVDATCDTEAADMVIRFAQDPGHAALRVEAGLTARIGGSGLWMWRRPVFV